MNERVLAKNQTSATPSQAIQASSPPLHQGPSTSGLSESFGSNSNISKGLGGIQPKTIRRSLNWQNISVEAPSRSDGRSSPGGIQCRQEEPGAVMGDRLSGDSVQKSARELSTSKISTEKPAQKPFIARSPLNGRNIPIEAPPRSSASSTSPGGIQRLETSGVKEQQVSTESLQRQPEGAIQAKSSEGEPQEKEGQNKESVQTKLTVGAPGDKYEQEANSMAAKVMTMPDSAIQQPIQRQTAKGREAVQMQPLVNSITPVVQRSSGKEEKVQMKPGVQRASDGSSQASGNVEKQLAGSKGGGSPLGDDVRSFMEPRFGANFSSVRVHTDSNAVQMNKELGAQAFAHGSDIYYGAGKSPGKNELTAHELTHTIQQGGAVQTKSVTGQEKKENKLQAKADAIQLTSNEKTQDSKNVVGDRNNRSKEDNDRDRDNVDWWNVKEIFTATDGEQHTLFFSGEDERATLMIASTPQPYKRFIDEVDVKGLKDDHPKKKAKTEAKPIADEIDKLISQRKGKGKGVQTPAGQDIQNKMIKQVKKLALKTMILADQTPTKPPSVVTYGPVNSQGGATWMNATVRSENIVAGSEPFAKPAIWEKAQRRKKHDYVRGHLLNHNLGGPGAQYNLSTITNQANKDHSNSVERHIKTAVKGNNVVRYRVEVKYNGHSLRTSTTAIKDRLENKTSTNPIQDTMKLAVMEYEEKEFPTSFETVWAILKHENGKWVDDTKVQAEKSKSILSNLPDTEPQI